MTYLYPRLLNGRARTLFGEFASIEAPRQLVGRAGLHDDAAVYAATGGTRVPADQLRSLQGGVRALASLHGYPDRGERAVEFDVSLARLLHESMDVAPAEAASRDLWAFFALVLLPDVAYWRFPSPPGDRILNTDITRHVFGRLWWRAELVHDVELADPYEALGVLGEADFDQVYARRAAIGASPRVVRSLLFVWRELRNDGALATVSDRDAFRRTLMGILRIVPFLSLNAISDDVLRAELRRSALTAIDEQKHDQGT